MLKRSILCLSLIWGCEFQNYAEDYSFSVDGINYKMMSAFDLTCTVEGVSSDLSTISIPEKVPYRNKELKVTRISDGAFRTNNNIKHIHLPSSIVQIGSGAFQDSSIESIDLPNPQDDYLYLEPYVFSGCRYLQHISFPINMYHLSDRCFLGCESLREIKCNEKIQTIGKECFKGCCNLEKFVVNDVIREISDNAFEDCGLLQEFIIPGSVSKIGNNIFLNCNRIKRVTFADSDSPLPIYNSIKLGCEVLSEIYVGRGFITSNDKQEKLVDFKKLVLNTKGRISIYSHKLEFLEIRSNLEEVRYLNVAIYYSNLKSVKLTLDEPPTCPSFTSKQIMDVELFVPKGTLDKCMNAEGWKNFWNIYEFDASAVGEIQCSDKKKNRGWKI